MGGVDLDFFWGEARVKVDLVAGDGFSLGAWWWTVDHTKGLMSAALTFTRQCTCECSFFIVFV